MARTVFLFHHPPVYPVLARLTTGVGLLNRVVSKLEAHEVFRQNARSREYMMNEARAAFPEFDPAAIIGPEGLGSVDWNSVNRLVLVWPDSNGLGWAPVEKRACALAAPGTEIVVLNGRRRQFRLADSKNLYLRRFLEKTFLADLAATTLFFIGTPFLLLIDAAKGKR